MTLPVSKLPAYTEMGPSFLASQPPSLSSDDAAPGKDWGVIYEHLQSRLKAMYVWRLSWWAQWARIAEYILPKRYHWLVIPNRMQKGVALNQSIIDSTATLAMQICAAGLWTGLTSPSRPWFKIDIGLPWLELDPDAKQWLEDAEQRLYTVLGGGNFYTTMAQGF